MLVKKSLVAKLMSRLPLEPYLDDTTISMERDPDGHPRWIIEGVCKCCAAPAMILSDPISLDDLPAACQHLQEVAFSLAYQLIGHT